MKKHSKKNKNQGQNLIELEEMNVILRIPKEAVAMKVTASFFLGGKVRKVSKKFTASEIHDARRAFLDNVDGGDGYDARFALTDEGRRFFEELLKTDDAARAANA